MQGIENCPPNRRAPGEPPYTLIDFFPPIRIYDECSIDYRDPVYAGDQARKQNLVDFGFRLPSALDNRPLRFEEFNEKLNQVIFVSATPGDYEMERSVVVAEQIIRPTGLVDPIVEVRPTENQIDDLMEAIRETVAKGYRVLVTTLTKRMAEDL